MKNWIKLIISIAISYLAGIIGSLSGPADSWYIGLVKPSFNPPNWIFGPAWLTLYTLMGVALCLVWTAKAKKDLKKLAIIAFSAQLMLNAAWSIIFFGLHSPLFAFMDIILLWLGILLTIILFYRVSKPASYLLVPYLLWVSFAAVLNYMIMILN